MDDHSKKLQDLTEEVSRLSKLTEQLLLAVAGSAAFEHKGLLQRQREDEEHREELTAEQQQFKVFVTQEIQGVKDYINERLKSVDRLETYFALLSNRTLWKIFWIMVIVGGLLISYYKGGYSKLVELSKLIFK
jgi:hypothetical protein